MEDKFSFAFGDHYIDCGRWAVAFRVYSEVNVFMPDPEDVVVSTSPDGMEIRSNRFAWAGGQQHCEGRFVARLRWVDDGFDCDIEARLDHRIKGTTMLLRLPKLARLPTREYDLVAFGTTPDVLVYPNDFRVPVFPLEHADGRFTAIASLDSSVRPKTVAVIANDSESRVVELHHHEDARQWSQRQITPTWRVLHTTDPAPLFNARQRLMEEAWGLKAWEDRQDVPEWSRRIGLVLNLHGMHWTGYLFNGYAEQLRAIQYVCERMDGRHVLAFLAGWDGRYNFNWPRYEPDARMGGAEGLQKLVTGAHALGVHVIPQIGAVSANRMYLPPGLHDCASHDAYGNTYVKAIDWDNDHQPDPYRLNANIGHPGFRQLLLDKTEHLVRQFAFDGIFVDINQRHHNDPRFSIVEGHLDFAEACHQRFDDFLVFGEAWYDGILPAYPLVHPVNAPGRGIPRRWSDIFHRYTRATYHLTHPAPSGSTGVYERGFIEPFVPDPALDIIPAIAFVDGTLDQHRPQVDLRIDAAHAYLQRTQG